MKKESNHPAGHDCPEDMKYSSTRGRCVQNSEAETVSSDSSSKNIIPNPNLRIPKVKLISGTSEGTPADSRAIKKTEFQDIHVDMVDKATNQQTQVQNIGFRVQGKQQIKAKTKFRNFSAKHGNRSTNL